MHDSPQRVSVVLEQADEDNEWIVVSLLIDERGRRQRSTLGRFTTREEARITSYNVCYTKLLRRIERDD